MQQDALISIKDCRIDNPRKTVVPLLNWTMKKGEVWLVIGPNGGGKADFFNALAGEAGLKFAPAQNFYNAFEKSIEIVSLEKAARIIQEERENDESDYVEGGVDIGRTGRRFIAERLTAQQAASLDSCPEVELTGIQKILDRGLKYMSTGEIRRTLLARALLSGKKLLLLSDPFAGLDAQSRKILFAFVSRMGEQTSGEAPCLILGMERWSEIPDSVTNVLEFTDKKVSFCGTRTEYEQLVLQRNKESQKSLQDNKEQFSQLYNQTKNEHQI